MNNTSHTNGDAFAEATAYLFDAMPEQAAPRLDNRLRIIDGKPEIVAVPFYPQQTAAIPVETLCREHVESAERLIAYWERQIAAKKAEIAAVKRMVAPNAEWTRAMKWTA